MGLLLNLGTVDMQDLGTCRARCKNYNDRARACSFENGVLQGIVWDEKWGWRMGIETLSPSNPNESQLSLRDPVRTCVSTQVSEARVRGGFAFRKFTSMTAFVHTF